VAAFVNGEVITKKTLDIQLAFMMDESPFNEQAEEYGVPEPSLEDQVLVLDLLIKMEAARQEAKRLGFEPAGSELDKLVEAAVEGFGGPQETEKALAESGETMEGFRAMVAKNATLKNWRDMNFLDKAKVTDEEAEQYYNAHLEEAAHGEEVKVEHIMFPLPMAEAGQGNQRGRIADRAREALELAKGGMNFDDLIPRYMDQTTLAATNSGQMGWVARGVTFPQLEEVIFDMKPGDISEVLETPFSLHIVKILDKRDPGVIPFQELKPEIISFLTEFKTDLLVQQRMNELVDQADVKIMDPELAKGWEEFRKMGSAEAVPAPEAQGD
jgi:parvulin-like peptidyl-prolyl isomerase